MIRSSANEDACVAFPAVDRYKPPVKPPPGFIAPSLVPEVHQPVDVRPHEEDAPRNDLIPEKTDKPDKTADEDHLGNREKQPIDNSEVFIMENHEERATSFFAQPGILAGTRFFWFRVFMVVVFFQRLSADAWLGYCAPFSLSCLLSIECGKRMKDLIH